MTTVLDQLSTDEPPAFGLLMSGRPVAGSGPTVEVRSRLDGSLLAELATAGPGDVRAAYEAAAQAAPAWAARTPPQRAAVLHRAAALFRERAAELADVITAEMGKPRAEALVEVEKGASVLDYYAEVGYRPLGRTFRTDADEDVFTVVEPLGVVALVTPWNFPFTIPLRKLSAALTSGNAVLFKPSMNAALCALVIGRTLLDAGIEPDVLHVVIGRSSVIENELLTAPELGGVSLTGSYETACAIRRTLPVEIPFQAELGGKNALLVWKDASIDLAVDVIRQSAFRNNGQICTSAGRVLVHEDVYEPLLDALVAGDHRRAPVERGGRARDPLLGRRAGQGRGDGGLRPESGEGRRAGRLGRAHPADDHRRPTRGSLTRTRSSARSSPSSGWTTSTVRWSWRTTPPTG